MRTLLPGQVILYIGPAYSELLEPTTETNIYSQVANNYKVFMVPRRPIRWHDPEIEIPFVRGIISYGLVERRDLILYSHWIYKSERFFELLEESWTKEESL